MPTAADAEQALRVADALPPGAEQVAASERALSLAEEIGDHHQRVQARINLVAAYEAAQPGVRELPHIAWLLGCLPPDKAGRVEPVTDRQRFEILWECRFALYRTRRSSSIPLGVVQRVHADVERTFRAGGLSPNLFAKHRALLARDLEGPAVVDRWLRVWRGSPRDELSDCEVCDVATDARFLAEEGDLAGALNRAGDLLEGRAACDQEPHRVYGEAADWSMRLQRVDAAEAYHRAGWLGVAGRPEFISAMAEHVMYLVRTNRPGRAVRLALTIAPLLDSPQGDRLDDVDRMRASAVVARVLRAGRGHKVSPPVVGGVPLGTAIARLEAVARTLAAAFDARNRTDRVSRRLGRLVRITAYPDVASEEVRTVDLLEVALTRAQPTPTPPAVPLPESAVDYAAELLEASDAFDAERVLQLVNGWASDRSRILSDTDLPVLEAREHLAVSYLDRRALSSQRARADEAFEAELLAGAGDAARLSGNRPAVQRMEIELLHRQALGGDGSAWTRAEKLVDELEAAGELREAAAALMGLSRNPDSAQGMEYALRAAELFERDGQPHWQVTALQAAGYAGVWADPQRAETLLRHAHEMAAEQGLASLTVAITATRAKLAWQTGNLDQAVLGYRDAVGASGEAGVSDPLGLRSELCDVLLQAGEWEELVDEAYELLARLDPGDVGRRALAHRVLGLGLVETGNLHEAAEVLEPAVLALERTGESLYAVASWTLGRALLGSGRPDLAAPAFVAAAAGFAAQGRLADAAPAHEAAGATLGRAGLTTRAAEHLVAAARLSRHLGDEHRMVSALRQLAGVQAVSGRVNEALSTLGSVIPEARSIAAIRTETAQEHRNQGFAEPIQEDRLRGLLEHQAALVLIEGGRADEAPPLLEDALALLSTYGEGSETAAAEETYHRLTGRMWTGSGAAREDHGGAKH